MDQIIDFLYPRRCFVCHKPSVSNKAELYLCPKCAGKLKPVREPTCIICGKPIANADKAYCYDCGRLERCFDQGCALYVYDELMKLSVVMFKEKGRVEYAAYYALGLYNRYKERYRDWKIDALIPVPLTKKKEKKRGFNQALLIAKSLGELLGLPVLDKLVTRWEGRVQKDLDAYEREKNAKNSFILSGNIVQSKSVLIVDDVFTTGNTIHYIAALLKKAGCKKVYFTTVCIGSEANDK